MRIEDCIEVTVESPHIDVVISVRAIHRDVHIPVAEELPSISRRMIGAEISVLERVGVLTGAGELTIRAGPPDEPVHRVVNSGQRPYF